MSMLCVDIVLSRSLQQPHIHMRLDKQHAFIFSICVQRKNTEKTHRRQILYFVIVFIIHTAVFL